MTTPNIYQKLQAVQTQIEELEKSELNKFQNYKYFTEYRVLKLLKPLLKEQQLTLTFSDSAEEFLYEKQERDYLVRYRKQAILTNSEKPNEQIIYHFWALGANQDPAKAKGAAETYAVKYFLQKLFLIPTTDNLDPDSK